MLKSKLNITLGWIGDWVVYDIVELGEMFGYVDGRLAATLWFEFHELDELINK
jgi:hypothetical protein